MEAEHRGGGPGRGDVLQALDELERELDGYEPSTTGEHAPVTAEDVARYRSAHEARL